MAKSVKTPDQAEAFAPDEEETIEDNEGAQDNGPEKEQEEEPEPEKPPAKPSKYSPHNPKNMGAVVIDIFGNKERRRRAIDLGLSDLILPPVTRKSIAKYRVLSKEEINPATKQLADVQPIYLEGNYMLYDKYEADFANRQKHMKNTTGKKERIRDRKTGQEFLEEVVEPVEFIDGVKIVNVEAQYRLYVFLELHPLNKSNKHRDTSSGVTPAFERIDIQTNKSTAFMLAEEELQEEAIAEIRKLTKVDDINAYATNAGIPTMEGQKQRDLALIKSDLRGWAFKNPRGFFSLSKNARHAIRMTVLEADSFGIIEYDPDKKKWYTPYTNEPLHLVLAGNDPVMDFVDHLAKPDNTLKYDAIRNMLDYWER
jgi:hypothetical protein